MQGQLDVLRDVSGKLQRLQIPYMITGSWALGFYAGPRMTRDIDVVIDLCADDVARFISGFQPEYLVFPELVQSAVKSCGMFNFIHQASIIKVDFIVRKNNAYSLAAFDRRTEVTLKGFQFFVSSKEDLILAKLLWSRDSRSEIQRQDIKSLLATGYDRDYVLDWAKRMDLMGWLEECASEGHGSCG
jgi:hypothetical protein